MGLEQKGPDMAGTALRRGNRFRSLRWRILFWMLPVALGPLVIMAAQGYHCARQAVIASQEAHLRSVLESRRTRLEAWLAQVRSDFRFLEASPCLRGLCGATPASADPDCCAEACNLLNDLQRGSPSYDVLGTYDSEWRLLVWSSGGRCWPPQGAVADREASRQPKAGGTEGAPEQGAIAEDEASRQHDSPGVEDAPLPPPALRENLRTSSELVLTSPQLRGDGRLIMDVGRRISPPEGAGPAYIVANLDVSRRIDPILQDRTGLGETGKAYLLTPGGRYTVAHEPRDASQPAVTRPLPQSIVGARSAVERYLDQGGIRVLGVSTHLSELDCTLVVEIDEGEAFAWLRVLRDRAIATGLVTLLLVLLIALRGARTLAQPLRALATVARRIASGHPEERVGPLEGEEAEEVSRAFNRMIDELDASHQRLLQAASLAAVGELSSSIVHEMRNPLSSIKMNLQALSRQVADDPPHAELAEIAAEQIARLEKMLSELLSYGKPLQLRPVGIPFAELARDVVDLARTEAEARGVELVVEDRAGVTTCAADREQIRRALTNLVINGVQASSRGGRVVLTAEIPSGMPDGVRISVTDQGRGIGGTPADQLFQPFFTTRQEGTGLGLANVKKIAECHGGSVFARNRPEGGACFGILLPRGGAWR